MKLRHSILALCASTATAASTSPADNNPLSARALTCAQMGGSYTSATTNTKFTVICKSTPNAAIPVSFLRTLSFDACLDACANLPLCVAAVFNSGFNDCNLYAAASGGVRSNPAYDFAMKAAPEPEPQPTTTSEATTPEAQITTTTSSEPTTTEVPTSEALSESTSQATVESTEVTPSIEPTTTATTSETLSTAITSIETSTDAETTTGAETSTNLEVSSTSEATTVPETTTTSEEPTTSGTTSLDTSALDTTTLETISISEVSTASETSALETSTVVVRSTTTEPGSSSTSEVLTETDDCDESSTTEPALPTTTLQSSEPLTTLTTSAIVTQDISTASESSSTASQSDSAVSFPCTTETQAATATSELSHNQSTSTLAGASSSSAGSKTVSDYVLPVTATSQYALLTSKVITVTEGGYVITKTVPCQIPSASDGYPVGRASSGATDDYQTRTGHGGYVDVQPTIGSHNYLPPDHEGGDPYGNGDSYADVDKGQTRTSHTDYLDAQPTAGSHTDVHSEYVNNLPSGTDHNLHVGAQPKHGGSQSDHRDNYSYVPVPSQGHFSKPRPGHEDDQPDHENINPSVSIQGSAQGVSHGEPYPTQGHVAQPITGAPKSGNPSPVNQSHEAASTTLATKAVVTNEAEAPKSTHGGDFSKAGEEPVAVSEASSYQVMVWTWMAMVVVLVSI